MSKSPCERLSALDLEARSAFLASMSDADVEAMLRDWRFYARPEQLAPEGDWRLWLILTGRGWGKTRTAAEWIVDRIEGRDPDGTLRPRGGTKFNSGLGKTTGDVRDVMIHGESGLLSVADRRRIRAKWEPSKRRVWFPDYSAQFLAYTAEDPDQSRGHQHETIWLDEAAIYPPKVDKEGNTAITNMLLGLRLGDDPRGVITTTPKPRPWLKDMVQEAQAAHEGAIRLTTGTLYDNAANLAAGYVADIVGRYKGTRLEAQEILGMLLWNVEGALWTPETIEPWRLRFAPPLERVRIGVDPSGTVAGECGIVVAGLLPADRPRNGSLEDVAHLLTARRRHAVVLADRSKRGTPEEWATQVADSMRLFNAESVVFERNFGHEMGRAVIQGVDPNIPVKMVHAAEGKWARAEPVGLLYQQGRVHHVGFFAELEGQMCSWVPETGQRSPDRLDALVWVLSDLLGLINAHRVRVTNPARGILPGSVHGLPDAPQGLTRTSIGVPASIAPPHA